VIRTLDTVMRLFDQHVRPGPCHGNERLHLRGMVGVLLAGAFEPAVRSLRTLDDLSLHAKVQAASGVDRVARSTLSDAMAKFDPQMLKPLMRAIQKQLPHLNRIDAETAGLAHKIIAADGSWFNLAGEVAHALHCRRGNAGQQSRVRLNLQLDVDSFCPTDFDVSGDGDGNEAAAFMRSLQGDCIYLTDRNFVNFAFVNAVLEKRSNLVLRLKKGVNFDVERTNQLTEKDATHHVLRDEVGILPGPKSDGNADARSCTSKPPTCLLRLVTVWDEKNLCEVMLLTDLLDVPAFVISVLYRLRWQIELFFRWLKVLAGFEHLVSQSARGITMQFYIAVLMALLIHLQTGARVSKYGLLWVSWLASERVTPEAMAQAMARHENERANAARRRLAKKQAI
jgi:Transposase DDE domain